MRRIACVPGERLPLPQWLRQATRATNSLGKATTSHTRRPLRPNCGMARPRRVAGSGLP